ncbi:RCC1/BLIP-II protein [Trichoderma citrinoviride]|uniref:RCC1/BLIP-II protein n=1 Tax=Trichoderma citrinoviride TaxID=58853 RepID=A0A2T4B124_9HYPO|nr:RCC1/BLIP-II protein [Trichoderma citrinoviride]PTB63027.1 RCC1/BLIP-II protein [Trichoderma citrinoviride]
MELFATGFNAWNQLSFSQDNLPEEPDDLYGFTKVLSAATIERPVSRLTYTIVRKDGDLILAGHGPSQHNLERLYASAETATGELLTIVQDPPQQDGDPDSNKLVKHASLSSWSSGANPESVFTCHPKARQIAAFNTGFVILHADGTVSTFGDPRFEACLGRDTDAPNPPPNLPGPVPDLHEIASAEDPMKHVTAGGSAVAALTTSGSVYVWGSRTLSSSSSSKAAETPHHHRPGHGFTELSSIPNYTEIDGGKDVVDVALGEGHAIALTADGLVYVIGENVNSQLGLGELGRGVWNTSGWLKHRFEAPEGFSIVGVAAGPRSSFILTAKR